AVLPRLPAVRRLRPSPPGGRRGTVSRSVDRAVRTIEVIGVALANAGLAVAVDGSNVALAATEIALSSALHLVNEVVSRLIWVAHFVARCAREGAALAVRIASRGMPAALSGARLSLVAPALALTASGLLTAAA